MPLKELINWGKELHLENILEQLNILYERRGVVIRRVIRRNTTSLLIDNTQTIFNECCCCYNEKELPLIIPCNHNVICYDCIMNLYNNHNTRKCPICRTEY